MTGNLIGEEFDGYVFNQINQRQTLSGKGYNVTNLEDSSLLSPREINLLNNKSSFIKLASGVNFFNYIDIPTFDEAYKAGAIDSNGVYDWGGAHRLKDTADEKENGYIVLDRGQEEYKLYKNQIKQNNKNQKLMGIKKLRNIGFTMNEAKSFANTNKLARNAILFAGLGSLGSDKIIKSRAGISQDGNSVWNSTPAYGLGGNQFGKSPMPGITSATINCINRGSIRTATVQIKAYNTFQFQLIELLYLKLGFTMMLEWGHNKYSSSDGSLKEVGSTLTEDMFFSSKIKTQLEVLQEIEIYRKKYEGNYDGFFGRVTNFNWDFAPDGTYNITLKLITLGDIIESLQVNLPSPINNISSDGSEVNGSNVLEVWLNKWEKRYNNLSRGYTQYKHNKNYLNLLNANYESQESNEIFRYTNPNGTIFNGTEEEVKAQIKRNLVEEWKEETGEEKEFYDKVRFQAELKSFKSQLGSQFNITNGLTKENSYYSTFGNLLRGIEKYIVPRVVNGDLNSSIISIGTDENINVVSAQPNQVSFDMGKCFIKPSLNVKGVTPPQFLQNSKIKDFFVIEKNGKDEDVIYGKLMNVYLNFEFIKSCLNKNTTKEGTLSLFSFLSSICDGINSSLGNVNKIEPIVNVEINEIVFIDQNPIKGNTEVLKTILGKVPAKQEIIPFEVFGFNQDKGKPKSNFVKSFKFESKIDSKLATMITIGTTAGGSSSKTIDGTAFASMNAGFIDRFQPQILPAPGFPNPIQEAEQAEKAEEENIDTKFAAYWGVKIDDVLSRNQYGVILRDLDKGGLRQKMLDDVNRNVGQGNYIRWVISEAGLVSAKWKQGEQKSGTFNGYTFKGLTYREALDGFKAFKSGEGANVVSENDIDLASSYQQWLMYALSGKLEGKTDVQGNPFIIGNDRAQYLNIENKEFFKKGKQSFREYIKLRDQKEYRLSGIPSNQSGFIPVTLSITMDGLSGVKIYQKLNVNQKFLPQEYQTNSETGTLDFIITKVDHKLSDNKWETTLSTLSIPPSKPTNQQALDKGIFEESIVVKVTEEERSYPVVTNVKPITNVQQQNNIQVVSTYLKNAGITREGAKGLIGNLLGESRLDPTIVERVRRDAGYTTGPGIGDKGGFGIAQWTGQKSGGRRKRLEDAAGGDISKRNDLNFQSEYLINELKTKYSSVFRQLKSSTSIEQSTIFVLEKFERPGSYINFKKDPNPDNTSKYNRTKNKRIALALSAEAYVDQIYNS